VLKPVGGEGESRIVEGKYRLAEELRRDRWAITYRAEHVGIQRWVEVKILPPALPEEGPDAAKLVREARAAGSVAHRNVQSVVDSGSDAGGRPYIVYEALEGPTLADALRESPDGLPTARAARIMLQVLEGLNAVHKGGVVHRAISPDNVLLMPVRGGGEIVKISGFDDAVFVAEAEIAEPPSRPPARDYIAPEARRRCVPAPTIDVYAAGVLLRFLLTGSPEPGRTLSDTARRAVERATAARPEERFPEAELFMHAVALLTATSERPAREEMPTPRDPLMADLHYLQLRRSTREETPRPRGEAKLHLLPVLMMIEAVYKKLGPELWSVLVSRIPEVEQLLPGAGNTDLHTTRGVPVDLLSRVLRAADESAGRGDLALAAEVGELMARRGLARIQPSLPKELEPDQVVDRFGELWSAVTRQGEVVLLDRNSGTARLAIRGQVEPSLELCAVMAGLVREGLRVAGATRAEVYTTACQALGDAACIYGVSWER